MLVLALLARPESVRSLPAHAKVLPLAPHLALPRDRLFAERPEALLTPAECEATDRVAEGFARGWYDTVTPASFVWKGVNLAECFGYELTFVIRDIVKCARLVERVLEADHPQILATDVPAASRTFPSRPYLYGIGSLLEHLAKRKGIEFTRLGPTAKPRKTAKTPSLVRTYVEVAARRGLSRLKRDRPLVAVGPFPEFYRPVARAWSDGGSSTVVVSPAIAPIRSAPAEGLFFIPFSAFLAAEDRRDLEAFLASARHAVEGCDWSRWKFPGEDETEAVVRKHLQSRLDQVLPDLAALGIAFDRGLDRGAHVLLMDTYSPLGKAAFRYAREKGLPVTVLQHGVIADPEGYRRTESGRIAAWGASDADWFRRNVDHPVQVDATGNPRYDPLAHGGKGESHAVLRDLPPEARVLLFASAPFGHLRAADSPWEWYRLQRMVIEAARAQTGSFLIVKRHPSEPPRPLPDPDGASLKAVLETRGGNTFALIRRSLVVMTVGSSVGLEAMYLGRPVVFLGRGEPGSPFHPPEDGAGLWALSSGELSDQLRRLLRDPAFRENVLGGQREYLRQHYAPLDGRAAERLVGFLRSSR